MKLEDQVNSLEQGQRLKELGVDGESLYCWVYPVNKAMISTQKGVSERGWAKQIIEENEGDEFDHDMAPAFTVAELGVLLPKGLGGNDGHNWSFYHRHCWKGESVGYSSYGTPSIEQGWYENEAQSRADMLIQLLETGKITAEQCNERLK